MISEKILTDKIRQLYFEERALLFVKGEKKYRVYYKPSSLYHSSHFRVLVTIGEVTSLIMLPNDPQIVAKFLIGEGLDVNCIDNT